MENKIDLSVIIISYNANQILDDCLRSIFVHTSGLNYEIIVVDNNTSNARVEDVIQKYPNICLIKNNSNRGFAAANNQGIEAAKGKYVLLLNNDTILIENSFKKVFDFAESKKGDFAVGCKVLNSDMSLQESAHDFDKIGNIFGESFFLYKIFPRSRIFNKYFHNYIGITSPCEVDWIKGCFIFVSRSLALRYHGLDERFFFFGEETDFCYRIKKDGARVYFFPDTSIIHLGGTTVEKMHWFKYKNQSCAKIKFYQKHFRGLKFLSAIVLHYTGIFLRIILYFLHGSVTFNSNLIKKSYYYFRLLFVYPANAFHN